MRRPSMVAVVALSLAACASAGGGGDGDDNPDDPDAANNPDDPDAADNPDDPDAAPGIDAAPMAVTLSQTTANNIVTPNTVVCASTIGTPPVTQYTLGNNFFRAFRLGDHGISGQFTASRIDLGIEQAETVAGQQTITVRLHTAPTFPGTMTQIHTQPVVITDVVTTIVPIDLTPPVVVPAGSQLVVEIVAPAHAAANNFFFPGSNISGESRDSYIAASECTIASPMPYSAVDGPAVVHLVLSVSGTTP